MSENRHATAMLVGRTTLTVTKATVLAALQKYLDETFKSAHVVVDVAVAPNCYDASAFTISLDDGAEAARPEGAPGGVQYVPAEAERGRA